jgi:hypothetical protein
MSRDGAEQLAALAKRLREAGENELRKELLRALREINKPIIADIRANARRTLPQRGGLAEVVAKSKIATRTRASGPRAGIQIRGTGKVRISAINKGKVRHPVFGNKKNWAEQKVKPGWFDEPIEANLPKVRESLVEAMDNIAQKIAGGGA